MQARIEGYYDHFPPKEMNVAVKPAVVDIGNSQTMKKNTLVVTKNFAAGEVIYKEDPVVAALDPDLESTGSHCSYCLRKIDSAMSLHFTDDPLRSAYCSKACKTKAGSESHDLLFGLNPPLPNNPTVSPVSEDGYRNRRQSQEKLVAKLTGDNVTMLLVARFISRQVSAETAKLGAASTSSSPTASNEKVRDEEYSLYDHIERLRYLELATQQEEVELISQVLEMAMPGLEQFITDERYTTLKGKMAYNAIGVCYGSGRDDKPVSQSKPENVEKTRTPYGTDRQIGSGLYQVSSYLSHSCSPSARPTFVDGTSTIHLIANHALAEGDELSMAYVDVSVRPDESLHEARLRRRKELARGWRFACACERCAEESSQSSNEVEKLVVDESKVEDAVHRYEGKASLSRERK